MDQVMSVELPDLSRRAIGWAVLRASAQHPAVVYPAAAGVLGGLGAVLLTASPVLLAGAAIGGAAALAGLGVNYLLRHQYFAARYIESAHEALVAYRAGTLANLEDDLREAGSHEGSSQFARFSEKIKAFEELLDDKLGRHEITYGRFLGIAEQVYLSGMDNLRQIASSMKSMQTVDEKYIRQRIASLESLDRRSEMNVQELASLKQQLDVSSQQLGKIETRLAQNEQALSQLDLALAAIADMKTGSSQAGISMETAMSDLQQIARRAGDYSSPQG